MKKQRNKSLLMILPLVLFPFVVLAEASSEAKIRVPNRINSFDNFPAGLVPAVTKALQEELPVAYHIKKSEASFRADNPGQNMRFTFTPVGVRVQSADSSWEWHMMLTRWGRQGAMKPVLNTNPVANGGRISYDRSANLTEWYLNAIWGMEQGFTLNRRPSASGGKASQVVLELALSGDLRPQLYDNDILKALGQTLVLYGTEGRAAVRYSGLQERSCPHAWNLQIIGCVYWSMTVLRVTRLR